MGVRHANALTREGSRVTVVVDPVAERGAALAPDAVVVRTLEEGLDQRDDFDVVVVATPTFSHLDDALAVLEGGVPVLVEKPHRAPGQDPTALMAADAAAGGAAFIGMSTRFWPGIRALIDAVGSGALGEIVSYRDVLGYRLDGGSLPPWYFDPAVSGGGVLLTNGVHALDRARAALGDLEVTSARLTQCFADHRAEDVAHVEARAGTTPAVFDIAWLPYAPAGQALTAVGTRGQAVVAMDGAWEIRTASNTISGPAIDIDAEPLRHQWSAFVNGTEGFGLVDLEPTLELVERIYQEVARG